MGRSAPEIDVFEAAVGVVVFLLSSYCGAQLFGWIVGVGYAVGGESISIESMGCKLFLYSSQYQCINRSDIYSLLMMGTRGRTLLRT